jgi:hypothetical protein
MAQPFSNAVLQFLTKQDTLVSYNIQFMLLGIYQKSQKLMHTRKLAQECDKKMEASKMFIHR